jgi:hypothetical protein
MQGPPTPTEDDEASIPTEHLQASIPAEHLLTVPHLGAGSRKAAMRTFPWKLTTEELQLELPRPQDEDEETRETKRPRLEEPLRTSTYAGTTENTSHATTAALPLPVATDNAADTADSVPVTNIRPNAGTTRDTWTLDEDAQLTSAVTKTREKEWGKEFKIDWVAVAMLVPGRTQRPCRDRWHNTLVSNVNPATARAGNWTADEDKKLKDSVRERGGKNWEKIAASVIGRTKTQCHNRWHHNLVSNIDPTTTRVGKWTADEDKNLKDAVRAHGGKNWKAITAQVPGRTKAQCRAKWTNISRGTALCVSLES